MQTLSPLVIALLACAALFAGTVDAIAGGGGLVTVPALLASGLDTRLVYGTNKGQSVWGSGAALVAFWRAGRVDRRQALFAFPLGLGGAALGALLVLHLDKALLRPIAIVLLIGASIVFVVKKPTRDETDPGLARPWVAALLAFVIAAYDGFFGPGTGTFLIVGFVSLCGKSMTHATADAKVVNFASNLASIVTFAVSGAVAWEVALPMAAGQLLGGVIGARLAIKGGAKLIRIAVLVVTAALVLRLAGELVLGLVRG